MLLYSIYYAHPLFPVTKRGCLKRETNVICCLLFILFLSLQVGRIEYTEINRSRPRRQT